MKQVQEQRPHYEEMLQLESTKMIGNIPEAKWEKLEATVRLLKTLSFFRRLPDKVLLENLHKMPLVEKKKGDLLFPDLTVMIIINGRVVLRQHERNPLQHKTLASYTCGQIIGYEELDDGMCRDCDVWVSVASKIVQYIEVERSTFAYLWKYSQTPEYQLRLCVL